MTSKKKIKQGLKAVQQRIENTLKEKDFKHLDSKAIASDWNKISKDFANVMHHQK